ncbi:type VI secretion system-associated protein VasI [Marinobacter sp. SS21]|uniref:type VI secretion system-associated protein VasI n=1 Tax=Marinobacter sp. SS21 TaxID=2979460 RepID=UPI00233135E2|nr:type VI secretion system-associated protein VasI [Marinobacter sp. SS21]MDC0662906.1 type VI secretion system-associated protein VasI [Marinobacter sp. SS21]
MIKRMEWRALLGLVWMLVAACAQAGDDALQAARSCTEEPQRLARLACFDAVFGTPLPTSQRPVQASPQPLRWLAAYAQEQARTPEDAVIYRDTGAAAGHLLTLAALGAVPPRPLLTVQCHNNITELALMLAEPLARERVELTFASGDSQLWRVRDNGYVVSAGRGLPAIRTLKALARQSQTQLHSSEAEVDGLMFDLAGLAAGLRPLREACGW